MGITEHKWSDEDVSFCDTTTRALIINVMDEDETTLQVYLNKSDAIAIAKHFGLFDGLNIVFGEDAERLEKEMIANEIAAGVREETEYD